MEVGIYHDGFCDSLATDIMEARCDVGDSGSADHVGAFSSSADDLHTRGILYIIHERDCPIIWSTSVHSI